ncbi:MAG: ATP-binding protein [Erysipelotrichaceae bacterium]|nr:ATP-binding protein [Erysipelotrichaceae bacterium]
MKLNKNILELYFHLLPVQIFLCIANSLSSLINGLVTGNLLSATAMIALGLVTPLNNLIASIATIVSAGSGILCGKYMGTGEADKVNKVYSNALIVSTVCGVVVGAACFIFAVPIASLLGAHPEALADTATYIRGIALGIVPLLLIPSLMTFLQMCNRSSFSLFSTILLAIFNTILGLVAVKMMNGGIFGIGIATSLSRWLTVLVMFIYIRTQKNLVRFNPKGYETAIVKRMITLGSPAALAGALYSIRNVFINNYAFTTAGATAVNSLAILGAAGGFYDSFNVGVLNTTTMLASVFIGERDSRSLKDLIIVAVFVGECLGALKLLVTYGFGDRIAMLFGAKDDVLPMATELLIFYAWSTPPNIITVILMAVYQSLGRVRFCNLLYPVNCIIVPLICCAVLAPVVGIRAIWSLYYLAEIVTLLCFYINACIRKKGLAKNMDDILYLDSDFDTANKYSISIDKIAEVISVSKQIQGFCLENGIDKKRSMLSGLCMEEMAANIVEHGFNMDKKEHTIDVFACVENDEVFLRLRDNCVPFDPHSQLQIYSEDDPAKNIGIKMVSKIAKEMNYQTTFGMNVLMIRL